MIPEWRFSLNKGVSKKRVHCTFKQIFSFVSRHRYIFKPHSSIIVCEFRSKVLSKTHSFFVPFCNGHPNSFEGKIKLKLICFNRDW